MRIQTFIAAGGSGRGRGGGSGFVFRTHKLEVRGGHKLFFSWKTRGRVGCLLFILRDIQQCCQHDWVTDWWCSRTCLERSGRGTIERNWTKPRKISVSILIDPTDFQHLPFNYAACSNEGTNCHQTKLVHMAVHRIMRASCPRITIYSPIRVH